MGFLEKLFNPLRKKETPSKYTQAVNRAVYQFLGNNMPLWKDANDENYITKGYNYNHQLYSVVSWKAQKSAGLDYAVYQNERGKLTKLDDHEALELIYNPNKEQGKSEFFEQFYGYKAITGNGYIYAPKLEFGRNKGKVAEMHVLPSQWVQIVAGGTLQPVKGYKIIYDEQAMAFSKENVIHSKYAQYYYNNGAELYGLSPIEAGWRLIQKSNENITAGKKSFENMGAAGLLYEKHGKEVDPLLGEMTKEQLAQFNRDIDKKIKGAHNRGRIFVTSAELGYVDFAVSPADLKMLEDAQANFRDICRIYKIPSEIFGDKDSATYNNVAEARKRAYTDGIMPDVKSFCDEFTRQVLPAYGENLVLKPDTSNVEELQQDRAELVNSLKDAYWIKTQRKQEIMGEEVDESLDAYFIPQNLIGSQELKSLDVSAQAQASKSDYFNE